MTYKLNPSHLGVVVRALCDLAKSLLPTLIFDSTSNHPNKASAHLCLILFPASQPKESYGLS